MIKYKITPEWIFFEAPKEIAVDKLNAVWNHKENMFRLPNTLGALREVYHLAGPKEQMEIAKYGMKKGMKREQFLSLKQLEDAPGDERLRPYQKVDVQYLKRLKAAGIFNQMRTGKTPTTLCLLNEIKPDRTIIVCPASLILNWQGECKKWSRFPLVLPCIGSKKERMTCYENFLKNKSVLIISYETLRNDLNELKDTLNQLRSTLWNTVVVDEAHRLRSLIKGRQASATAKAVRDIGKLCDRRYTLTGTPTVRSGDEIWGILHFLYPERFPGYWQFVDRYFETKDGFFGGKDIGEYKRQQELEEILTLISTNRKRKEVMQWLPEKQYQMIRLEMTDNQKKHYNAMLETFEIEEDGELKVDAPSPLAQLTRLRQITTSPQMLELIENGAKEQFILEWLEDNPNESVIIFSSFTSYLKLLHKKIEGSVMITGEQTKNDRKRAEQLFQGGDAKVLLANIIAAGTGLTLDKGETVIFIDKAYNPSDNEQAEDRIIPTSEERNHSTTIISLVCKDTMDEVIEGLLVKKINVTSVINNAGIEGLRRLNDG